MTPGSGVTFGVVLPHFGVDRPGRSLLDAAVAAEELGLHAAWCRDHLVYRPHVWEPGGPTFIEQYVSLAAVAAVTERLGLGAGATIPFRAPEHVLLLADSLVALAGPRVHIGLGRGDYSDELSLAGGGPEAARTRRRDTLELLQQWAPGTGTGIWWAGTGPRAAADSLDRGVGWLAGRQPTDRLRERMAMLRDRAAGRPLPRVGVWVIADYDHASGRCGDRLPPEVFAFSSGGAVPDAPLAAERPAGTAEASSAERQWRGSVLHGPPEQARHDLDELARAGADHIVLDLRFSPPDTWQRDLTGLVREVLGSSALASGRSETCGGSMSSAEHYREDT